MDGRRLILRLSVSLDVVTEIDIMYETFMYPTDIMYETFMYPTDIMYDLFLYPTQSKIQRTASR